MQELLRAPRASWLFGLMALFGLGLFIFAIAVVMAGPSRLIGDRPPEMTCLQVAFTPERLTNVVLGFSEEIREPIAELLVPGDMFLAWGYGFLLAGLLGLLAIRLPNPWFRVGAIIMWAPLLSSTFDCIEDIFLHTGIQQLVANPAADIHFLIPLLAGIAATFKYLGISVLAPAYGIAGSIKGIRQDKSISATAFYLLVIVVMVSFVIQPMQQIPPCFN